MRLALLILLSALPAMANAQKPTMSRAEARLLYAAGGFPISADNKGPRNRCNQPASPTITFVDVNGDGRRDALFADKGTCYAPDQRWFAIAVNEGPGAWRGVGGFPGSVQAVGKDKAGWFELVWTSNGRQLPLLYNGTAYATAPLPAASPARTANNADRDTAIFRAAGLKRVKGIWESENCPAPHEASYSPGSIDAVRDLNGDGRPEAVVIEGGGMCYGNTGQAFWIVTQTKESGWKLVYQAVGIPEFLQTKGVGGWPDLVVGGPGFCFPMLRWNGTAYMPRGHMYDGKPCRPR